MPVCASDRIRLWTFWAVIAFLLLHSLVQYNSSTLTTSQQTSARDFKWRITSLVTKTGYYIHSENVQPPSYSEERHGNEGNALIGLEERGKRSDEIAPRNGDHQTKKSSAYVLQPDDMTCAYRNNIVIWVSSALQNFNLRQAIRDTWGKKTNSNKKLSIFFAVGEASPEFSHLQKVVQNESEHFHDVLQVNVVDHYVNLTRKSLHIMEWSHMHCRGAKYFMKCDDDIFINTEYLERTLLDIERNYTSDFILGYKMRGAKPIENRFSKYYTSTSIYHKKIYPDYISGSAYVISGSLIPRICSAAIETPLFWLEDVFISGMLAGQVGGTLIHSELFSYRKRKLNPCVYRHLISVHELIASDLYQIWSMLHRPDTRCLN